MTLNHQDSTAQSGLLGDTAERDYSRKLQLFNAFAAPQIRAALSRFGVKPGMRVLDAGCGTGEALVWLTEAVGPTGKVLGIDLATAHVVAARATAPANALVLQGDLVRTPFPEASFDLIWSLNTINHLREPQTALRDLAKLLRVGGRIVLGQSSLLPDMYFAWDARLERVTTEAVRRYYWERYALDERDLTSVRAIAGLLRSAGLETVSVDTIVLERLTPLDAADEAYLLEAIFRGTWGERLRPYMTNEDFSALTRLCDPDSPQFALRRTDFHFLQTLTFAIGSHPGDRR